MKKVKLKIGDVAKELNIKKSLIRQWENEYNLTTRGQNSYTMEDMEVLVHIKDLIRTQGLSSDLVKEELEKLPQMQAATKFSDEAKVAQEVSEPTPSPVEQAQVDPPASDLFDEVADDDELSLAEATQEIEELMQEIETLSVEEASQAEPAPVQEVEETSVIGDKIVQETVAQAAPMSEELLAIRKEFSAQLVELRGALLRLKKLVS